MGDKPKTEKYRGGRPPRYGKEKLIRFALRVPESLYSAICADADQRDISINESILDSIRDQHGDG